MVPSRTVKSEITEASLVEESPGGLVSAAGGTG